MMDIGKNFLGELNGSWSNHAATSTWWGDRPAVIQSSAGPFLNKKPTSSNGAATVCSLVRPIDRSIVHDDVDLLTRWTAFCCRLRTKARLDNDQQMRDPRDIGDVSSVNIICILPCVYILSFWSKYYQKIPCGASQKLILLSIAPKLEKFSMNAPKPENKIKEGHKDLFPLQLTPLSVHTNGSARYGIKFSVLHS